MKLLALAIFIYALISLVFKKENTIKVFYYFILGITILLIQTGNQKLGILLISLAYLITIYSLKKSRKSEQLK